MRIVQQNIRELVSHIEFDLSSLTLEQKIPFDLFIKKDKNFLIIIEEGTLITQKIFSQLQKQTTLFIQKEDQHKKNLGYQNLHSYLQSNLALHKVTLSLLYAVIEKQFEHMLKHEKVLIDMEFVDSFVSDVTYLIESDPHYLKNSVKYFSCDYNLAIHSLHITIYSLNIAYQLQLTDKEIHEIGVAALLHDIGMEEIDQKILDKTTKLNEEDTHIIQTHPKLSVEILEHNHIHNPYILDAVMHHHERYDGSGYPNQLFENQISKYASILAICDVFDALTNNRPYRKKHSSFEALQMMMKDPTMQNNFNRDYLKLFLKSLT